MSTAQKLQVFDTYWNTVHRIWGGFPNLVVNWDSLRNAYRPIVAAGVSRGRFAGIMTRLTRALSEWHVYASDRGIDSTWGMYWWNGFEYPNQPSFRYTPGIPLLYLSGPGIRTNFGAGITPFQDSIALIYSVMPDHPLNLRPGDVILGYDRKPWKQLLTELNEAELPASGGGTFGSTRAATDHYSVKWAGANWGLYDTIDVLKYPSNDTVHFPTSLLRSITPPYHVATEQMPIAGVQFPDVQTNKLVSWGVVSGTDIGYVYVWDWYGVPDGNTRFQFGEAISDLLNYHKVSGLILDFRTNLGGWEHYANLGFSGLFTVDPTNNYSRAWRVTGDDHFLFTLRTAYFPDYFTPSSPGFDHPIAVLTGPCCGSAGDYNAFRLRFHPMVRFFGKATAGAYTDLDDSPYFSINGYTCRVDPACVYSNVGDEAYMIHKAFPVDEEVWLSRDGVARGEDGVVKRALEWIRSQAYVYHVTPKVPYSPAGVDSFTVTGLVRDPNNHSVSASLILRTAGGTIVDSAVFLDDGHHGDGIAGDNIIGARFPSPSTKGFFKIDLRTRDHTTGQTRILPGVSLITTLGPVFCAGDTSSTTPRWGQTVGFRLKIGNAGSMLSIPNIDGVIRPLDTAATLASSGASFAVGDVAPGEVRISSLIQITFSPSDTTTRDIAFELLLTSGGTFYWRDTLMIRVFGPVGDVAEEQRTPPEFALEQNYPNPFNPNSDIRYRISEFRITRLGVYDVLGREVAVLVNEPKMPGEYQVKFDATGLPSGMYFYRLQSGNFTEIKKMVLIR